MLKGDFHTQEVRMNSTGDEERGNIYITRKTSDRNYVDVDIPDITTIHTKREILIF